MPLMTPFHHSQLNSPVLVEVGQLIPYMFANVSKNHDPSSLRVQKTNRMKYDTQMKMVSYDSAHTRKNLHVTPYHDLCDLCPQLTFNELFPTVTQNHKTAHTLFPNDLNQISIPRTSIAPSTTFHESHCNSRI